MRKIPSFYCRTQKSDCSTSIPAGCKPLPHYRRNSGIEADRRTPPRHIPNTGSPTAAFEQYDMQTKGIGSYKIIPAHLDRTS